MNISPLQEERLKYEPKLPGMLRHGISEISVKEGEATESVADQDKIKALFPNTYGKKEITFEIQKHIGVIQEENKGWRKELNRVSWNGGPAKYDIRAWSADYQKMDRGITLKPGEMRNLKTLLEDLEINDA